MSKIKGQNLRVFIMGSVFAEATNCVITLTSNMEDVSTKDSVGLFTENGVASKGFQVQVDALRIENISAFLTTWKNHAPVTLMWDQTDPDDNTTALAADFKRTGSAILSDATFQFNDRQFCTANVTFTGTGAI